MRQSHSLSHHARTQRQTPAQPPTEGTIFTCLMYPQVRQAGPGSWPICGMDLEPILPTSQAVPSPELRDMTRRFTAAYNLVRLPKLLQDVP